MITVMVFLGLELAVIEVQTASNVQKSLAAGILIFMAFWATALKERALARVQILFLGLQVLRQFGQLLCYVRQGTDEGMETQGYCKPEVDGVLDLMEDGTRLC